MQLVLSWLFLLFDYFVNFFYYFLSCYFFHLSLLPIFWLIVVIKLQLFWAAVIAAHYFDVFVSFHEDVWIGTAKQTNCFCFCRKRDMHWSCICRDHKFRI